MRIYLDHNATTPVRDEVAAAVLRALRDVPGNPSSAHAEGAAARAELERARERVATLVGAKPGEVVFTSGATESNNLALHGIARAGENRHLVTTTAEHPSVEEPIAALEADGYRVTRIAVDADVSGLLRDAFRFHWLEECQHAIVDEIEWQRADRRLTQRERDHAVADLIELISAMDGLVQQQAAADTAYFHAISGRAFSHQQSRAIHAVFLRAYRWQHISAGVRHPHFVRLLSSMTTMQQQQRIRSALASILWDRAEATAV